MINIFLKQNALNIHYLEQEYVYGKIIVVEIKNVLKQVGILKQMMNAINGFLIVLLMDMDVQIRLWGIVPNFLEHLFIAKT